MGDQWKVAIGCMSGNTLRSEAFKTAWLEWCQYRRESKKPLTQATIERQIKTLESWGEARAIAAIRHTVFKGWQGLREPDEGYTGGRAGRSEPKPGKYDNLKIFRGGS